MSLSSPLLGCPLCCLRSQVAATCYRCFSSSSTVERGCLLPDTSSRKCSHFPSCGLGHTWLQKGNGLQQYPEPIVIQWPPTCGPEAPCRRVNTANWRLFAGGSLAGSFLDLRRSLCTPRTDKSASLPEILCTNTMVCTEHLPPSASLEFWHMLSKGCLHG